MSNWRYMDSDIDESIIPAEAIGFVYRITRLDSSRAYIGKKLLFFTQTKQKTVTLKNGTKKKKKIRNQIPSDWRTYWGSSVEVVSDVKEFGEEAFTREILFFCSSKGSMGYWEAQLQMELRVLEQPELYYNGIINCRIHKSHVKPKLIPERSNHS